MESLLPTAIVEKLDKQFGAGFRALPEIERIALVVAESEGMVDHKRLKDISTLHPSDISKALNNLVKNRFLKTGGAGRGTYYYLSGSELDGLMSDSEGLLGSSEGLLANSEGFNTGSEGFEEEENRVSFPAKRKQFIIGTKKFVDIPT